MPERGCWTVYLEVAGFVFHEVRLWPIRIVISSIILPISHLRHLSCFTLLSRIEPVIPQPLLQIRNPRLKRFDLLARDGLAQILACIPAALVLVYLARPAFWMYAVALYSSEPKSASRANLTSLTHLLRQFSHAFPTLWRRFFPSGGG